MSMDASEFLFPNDLAVSPTPLTKVLLLGSCMAEAYRDRFRAIAPHVTFDWILFNNPNPLPDLPDTHLRAYDFQYVQLSLRHVVRDEVVNFPEIIAGNNAEPLLERARAMLRLILDAALQYNKSHNILTFVANFFVPQVPVVAALDHTGSARDFTTLVRRLNEELAGLVTQYHNVYLADVESVAGSLGKRFFLDDVIGFYAHAGYWGPVNHEFDISPAFNAPPAGRLDPLLPMEQVYESRAAELFQTVWRHAECLYRTINQIDMVKLVIFDLDDTMWRGQIAEHYGEGATPPVLHGWPLGMWEAVQHLRARGIITAICSKNEESLVRARWGRAVLPWITLDDFPLREINWRPKAENAAAIIRAAGVTPRGTVFVDDNPVERESVKAALPGLRVLGANPHVIRRILLWSPETQLAFRSAESAGREQSIKQMGKRETDRAALSREEFLRSLDCRVKLTAIAGPAHPDFARAVELLNKTNQFNTTGIRWTTQQILEFFRIGGTIYSFGVTDRYTAYGQVGTILYKDGGFAQFAMSCRVLGLEIETSVMHTIMQSLSAQTGRNAFFARVLETDANIVCRDLFTRCGFTAAQDDPSLFIRPPIPIPPPAPHITIEA